MLRPESVPHQGSAGGITSRLCALLRDCSGAEAIETVFVAPIFILMLLITIELGFMIFTQSVLDGGTRTAARDIRTGQAQGSANPLAAFQGVLCNNINVAISCGAVVTDVESFANFSSMSLTPVKTNKSGQVTNNTFTPGNPGSAVAVRVFYTYQFIVPWVSQVLNPGGNGVVLESTVVFQNEPYPTAG